MSRAIKIVLIFMMFMYTRRSIWSFFDNVDENRILLDTVTGSVGWGNYSFWKLSHEGPLIIQLQSLTGDADLYVSENEKPGYELDEYNLSSVTCGLDEVFIPSDFPRPIGIGIYGHTPFAISDYVMSVEIDVRAIAEDWDRYVSAGLVYDEGGDAGVAGGGGDGREGIENNRPTPKGPSKTDGNPDETGRSTKFIGLLSILDMLLEIFIM